MQRFGEVALKAWEKATRSNDPKRAWEEASTEMCGEGTSMQKKGCPREAFLGLCEAGLVKDIRGGGGYTRSESSKQYATKAVEILRLGDDPNLVSDRNRLWRRVLRELKMQEYKEHNGQMDVVLSLWRARLVKNS